MPVIRYQLQYSRLGAVPNGAGFLSSLDSRSQVPAELVIILASGKHIFFRLNNSAVPSQHHAFPDWFSFAEERLNRIWNFLKSPRSNDR
jgi:hypothetical protein